MLTTLSGCVGNCFDTDKSYHLSLFKDWADPKQDETASESL